MSCFLLVAAFFIQFTRQLAETLTHGRSLHRLPAAKCRARILQPLREQIPAPAAAVICIKPARRLIVPRILLGLECVNVQLERGKLAGSVARR